MAGHTENDMIHSGSNLLEELEIGMWTLDLTEGRKPRLYADTRMKDLMGFSQDISPEETYERWLKGLDTEAASLVNDGFGKMEEGIVSEIQYYWNHPDGSRRMIRCGGRVDNTFTDGKRFCGTYRDITAIDHLDNDWHRRSKLLRSYFSYYSARDALVILLVNPDTDRYILIKNHPSIEGRLKMNQEGIFSEFVRRFAGLFANGAQAMKLLKFQDYPFLDRHFQTSPVYRTIFEYYGFHGDVKWYRVTANRQDNNDMVVSLEDRTQSVSENIILNTIASRLVGGFIFNLKRDIISVVKMTPFFNYLDGDKDRLSISAGVDMLCPHMDEEFREGWRHFASMENLMSVYNSQRRADYAFKTMFAGEHTWLRASIYAVSTESYSEPSVSLVFRKFSREEIEEANQNEEVLHQKEKLEKEFRFIKGIAQQYVSLKIIRIDGHFSIAYKDLDPSYGWDRGVYSNFWDSYMAMMKIHCHPDNMDRMMRFADKDYVVSVMKGRRRHMERFRFRMHDGSYIWMDAVFIRFDRILDNELTEFAFALANVDVEVRKEKEYAKALEQARISREESRLKTQFVNNISHDIRTPLNAVIGYSQLLTLAGDTLSEEEKAEYVNYIETSGELLTMLIDDILSVSDIEHDILKIRYSTTSCNLICRKAVSCCMMRVPNNVRLYFTTDFDDDFSLETDSRRIQQILINMISNSCKATTEGEIRVHCCRSAKEEHIDFIVTDTGCGVAPEKAEEIFNRFVSVDNNDSGAGHGLGLDICIKISQRMGGFIWLDQSYTGGARFVLTLPLKR